jgi:hypothetical protein
VAKTIEDAFLGKEEKFNLDSERYVSFAKMRQVRLDNEKRYRNIRREVVTEMSDSKDDEKEEEKDEEEEESEKKATKKGDDDDDEKEVEVRFF